MPNTIFLVLCTCPDEDSARRLSGFLVQKKLAACISIVNPISSIFAWQGRIDTQQESLLLIKTTETAYSALEQAIKQQHPYEVPEIIAIPIHQGSMDYLNWIRENTCTD
jgi:periplasmic divalent cation tolerance protein